MKHRCLTALPAAALLCSCASGPLGGGSNAGKRATYGAATGAAVGAVAGATVGDPFSGAAVGAVAGGAIGALVKGPVVDGRQYYRDNRGYCYYIDRKGKPKYASKVRC